MYTSYLGISEEAEMSIDNQYKETSEQIIGKDYCEWGTICNYSQLWARPSFDCELSKFRNK